MDDSFVLNCDILHIGDKFTFATTTKKKINHQITQTPKKTSVTRWPPFSKLYADMQNEEIYHKSKILSTPINHN